MPVAFSLRNVTYRKILSIPVLDIPAGSLYGVTGKSGSGKTTLLKLLNNLITCDHGEINYYGKNLLSFDPISLRRRVLMVPQAPYIFPGTVYENIRLVFHFNRKKEPLQGEIEKLLADFGMPGILKRETSILSGGEKERLALARAILLDPETLLLDEPTASLDEDNAILIFSYLGKWVRKPGRSVVMISHAAGLISEHAGIILNLAGGCVKSIEERREVNV